MQWVIAHIASDPGELKEGSLGRRDMCNKWIVVARFCLDAKRAKSGVKTS